VVKTCNCKLLLPPGEYKRRAIPPFTKSLWCLFIQRLRTCFHFNTFLYVSNVHQNLWIYVRLRSFVVLLALGCPALVLPSGVSVEECPRRPVYGDVCVFRCVDNDKSSTRSVRSCEVKNFNSVYWTGQFPPRCPGLY